MRPWADWSKIYEGIHTYIIISRVIFYNTSSFRILSLLKIFKNYSQAVVGTCFNPSAWETEAGRSL